MKKLLELEQRIGYKFENFDLLVKAMTHSSYANEHRYEKKENNERLEFLGDAVLELISSDYLFAKYPETPEGVLTKKRASMVCEPTLALCAREIPLGDYLLLGKGEDATGGRKRDSIVSDAMEALIGAIYLDGGFANAKEFIDRFILNDIEKKKVRITIRAFMFMLCLEVRYWEKEQAIPKRQQNSRLHIVQLKNLRVRVAYVFKKH